MKSDILGLTACIVVTLILLHFFLKYDGNYDSKKKARNTLVYGVSWLASVLLIFGLFYFLANIIKSIISIIF